MRKLKLDPETLRVESFGTVPTGAGAGTVYGAQDRVFAGIGAAQDTGCTQPCLSEESVCPILSCGSSCDPDGEIVTHPDQPAGTTG